MRAIRITNSVFATNAGGTAEEVVKGGVDVPEDDAEGLRQIARNNAVFVDVPDEAKPEGDGKKGKKPAEKAE